jgi:elongation factor G
MGTTIERALLSLTIKPKTDADRERLARGVAALMAEDPALSATIDSVTGEALVAGMGELHLEIIADRLRHEYGVEADVGRPEVVFREALTRPADGEARYRRLGDRRDHYAHVKIHVHPGEPGSGYLFDVAITPGAIPEAYIGAIHDGIEEALGAGIVSGYPVDDVRVVLYDGSYHDVDSSETAFRIAGTMAFHDAARKAQPRLLEPVMRVEITTPKEYAGAVMADLVRRQGQIQSLEDRGPFAKRISARVALSRILGFAADLRARTEGRGTFGMRLSGYQPVDPESPDAGESMSGVPRRPLPTLRNSSVALPEPEQDEWLD